VTDPAKALSRWLAGSIPLVVPSAMLGACATIAGIEAPTDRAADGQAEDRAAAVTADATAEDEEAPAESTGPDGPPETSATGSDVQSGDSTASDVVAVDSAADRKPPTCTPGGGYGTSDYECCSTSCTSNYCD